MNPRYLTILLGCLIGALAQVSLADPVATRASRANVILFLTDDQAWGDLGYHDNPRLKTPHLDAFAHEAVALTRFYVSPVCAPTRASLLTGRYNFRTGVTDVFGAAHHMDPMEVTVAEVLREAGYATGIFGKWHLGDEGLHAPNAQGFDESLVSRGAVIPADQYFDPELLLNGQPRQFTGYCMDVFTDAAIEFVKQNRTQPFFVYLPTNLVHTPLKVADELAEPFRQGGLDAETATVYGMLTSVDNNFGRLCSALEQLGVDRNTLFIFTSDNGPCAGSITADRYMAGLHGLKGTVYENGIRVPCFVRWPAVIRRSGQVNQLAAHIDIMPTILEACGVRPPSGVAMDGISLLPVLKNLSEDWPDRTFVFQWDSGLVPRRGHAFTVLTKRWKLVQPTGMDKPKQQHIRDRYAELCKLQGRGDRSIEGGRRYELYDVAADPGEWNDVAADHPDIVEQLNEHYNAWFDDVCRRWHKKTE